jgi:MarR family transcriptional regulator, organic hydroperoxide resistance regulator
MNLGEIGSGMTAGRLDRRKAVAARQSTEHIRRLVMGSRALLEERLRGEGMTLAQLRLLKAVKHESGVSAAALARACGVTPQTMQAVLMRAVREEWIVRGKSERNERFVTASLTKLGERSLERGAAMLARIEEEIWRGVGVGTLREMNAVLEAGVGNLERELERIGAV